MRRRRSATGEDTPLKSTLYCPECDHRSPATGEWNVSETARRTRYRCPECRTSVLTQPRYDDGETAAPVVAMWGRSVRGVVDQLRLCRRFWAETTA
ncbi:hypothetical protein ACAH01_16470 (plasmid) [Halomicrobium sp. HM KBTZ05]|uniref:DUF8106 domain-containing protein n=1 Tax=Halomicrobium mukohataei TaxID=57705 RepID=A0A847UH98_9EURY|nr:hypothetical protein [Halomicrobium mukohataei]NLV11627.1 hypothetical protein [Halomicrobium mukohataei]